jgi:hypothetical protein
VYPLPKGFGSLHIVDDDSRVVPDVGPNHEATAGCDRRCFISNRFCVGDEILAFVRGEQAWNRIDAVGNSHGFFVQCAKRLTACQDPSVGLSKHNS